MDLKVYKYVLFEFPGESIPSDTFDVHLPRGAKLLAVQHQAKHMKLMDIHQGPVCLWALIDEDEPTVRRRVRCYGTGFAIDGVNPHISTVQLAEGRITLHFFDLGELAP